MFVFVIKMARRGHSMLRKPKAVDPKSTKRKKSTRRHVFGATNMMFKGGHGLQIRVSYLAAAAAAAAVPPSLLPSDAHVLHSKWSV